MDYKGCRGPSVNRATETREVVSLAIDRMRLFGTFHKCPAKSMPLQHKQTPRIGILFPNSGVMPRAATGDSAVYWADCFARAGYPTFRFDLEGLGDSDGRAPTRVLDFLSRVNTGHYAPQVRAIAKNITDRFDLSSVVLVAHCGGTVSAVYAAASANEVKGLVLMDPYFHLQEVGRQRELTGAQQNGLPSNANQPLIDCWNRIASSGTPMLVLTAPSFRAKGGGFDYLDYLTTSNPGNVTVEAVENTPHSFAEGPGRDEVRKRIERWLGTWFPVTESPEPLNSALELSALGSS